MTVDPTTMRDTLRFWSTGVSIVAAAAPASANLPFPYVGMTVSSVTSLSLEPPHILVCLAKNSATTETILAAGSFAVSILTDEQSSISDRFAGRVSLGAHVDRFVDLPLATAITGAPILRDALAWLDCRIDSIHEGSTHWIVIGEVVAVGHQDAGTASPLIYFDRAYHSLTPERERP